MSLDWFSRMHHRAPVRFAAACGLAVAMLGMVSGVSRLISVPLYPALARLQLQRMSDPPQISPPSGTGSPTTG